MRIETRLAWILVVGLLATVAFAQHAGERNADDPPKRATKIPTEGFWPTKKMMERVVDRITDDMVRRYEFDDHQLELTRELFKARFPEFLNENRAEIQTLVNQYFEAILDDEPPPVEAVAEWAQRVQPLLAEFNEVCTEVADGMREYLNDDQVSILETEQAGFQTGVQFAQNKLGAWAEGGYDPETEWLHRGSSRHEREETAEVQVPAEEGAVSPDSAAEAAAQAAGSEKTASRIPKDSWTIYTERFIERYQLNDEQRQKAFMLLRRQQEQRDQYLRRRVNEMARVTQLLKEAESEPERQAALEAYDRLNVPIERMFEQLKTRLDTLPTRAQRKAAADTELEPDTRPVRPEEADRPVREEEPVEE